MFRCFNCGKSFDDDEILECSMEVHQPNRRKKVDEKLTALFQQFALSCALTLSE